MRIIIAIVFGKLIGTLCFRDDPPLKRRYATQPFHAVLPGLKGRAKFKGRYASQYKMNWDPQSPPFDQIQPQRLIFERTFERSAMELRIHND